MYPLPKFCSAADAPGLIQALGEEFAVVANPGYIHPPYELYPLAAKAAPPLPRLLAVVCDMDGTTTTTEPLCIHSLEHMIRRASGRPQPADWPGLSPQRDYPHIIGNSTTRHVEYLLETYAATLRPQPFWQALLEAVIWTIALGRDEGRRGEALAAARLLGLEETLEKGGLIDAAASSAPSGGPGGAIPSVARDRDALPASGELLRGAIEIYYARYHQILEALARGEGAALAREILGSAGPGSAARLIEPMPGAALFLAAARGLLDAAAAASLYDALAPALLTTHHGRRGARELAPGELEAGRAGFLRAAAAFRREPLKVAIVTSSIRYEAEIVLREVFAVLREEIEAWPLPPEPRARIAEALRSPEAYYDAILTASDSSEIRLKPHRDLYSMALHRLGLAPADFGAVLGLEDSESGLIAIRAAGVGLAVAVPFAQTRGHDLAAAARVNHGGLPELMFRDGFYLG